MGIEPSEAAAAEAPAEGIRLVLHNNMTEVTRLSRWLRRWADERALPAEISFALGVCLEQAVTGVIMASDPDHDEVEITVEIERTAVTLIVRVEDNGRPLPYPDARSKVSALERARMGELGFRLMRSFASGIEYERRDERNRLTLRFLQTEPPSMLTG
jgi:serine/threonine-protein kinase RsbW